MGEREHIAFLIERLGDQDMLKAMRAFRDLLLYGSNALEPLAQKLKAKGTPRRLRLRIIDLLGKLGVENAAPILEEFLERKDKKFRAQACIALGWLRNMDALPELQKVARDDPDRRVRNEARIAIEELIRFHASKPPVLPSPDVEQTAEEMGVVFDQVVAGHMLPETKYRYLKATKHIPQLVALHYSVCPFWLEEGGLTCIISQPGDPVVKNHIRELLSCPLEWLECEEERVGKAIQELYVLGRDDYYYFYSEYTAAMKQELARLVREQIVAASPYQLPECPDSLYALNSLLHLCRAQGIHTLLIESTQLVFRIYALHEKERINLPVPPENLQLKLILALKILCQQFPHQLEHAGRRSEVVIRNASGTISLMLWVKATGRREHVQLSLTYER